jgi:hypothetical protein
VVAVGGRAGAVGRLGDHRAVGRGVDGRELDVTGVGRGEDGLVVTRGCPRRASERDAENDRDAYDEKGEPAAREVAMPHVLVLLPPPAGREAERGDTPVVNRQVWDIAAASRPYPEGMLARSPRRVKRRSQPSWSRNMRRGEYH